MNSTGLHSAFLDFTVWDNDGLYALVTVVSIVFTIALIIVVMRKSREHDAANHGKTASALSRSRTAQASDTDANQPMITAQSMPANMPQPTALPSSTQPGQ